MRSLALLISLVIGLVHAAQACPHDSAAAGPAPKKLGTVSFQNACSPEVQAELSRGIALEHSFWFGEAQKSFEKVAAADPQCAIASWGVAMSLVPWLNAYPDAATAAAAQKALKAADAATKKSPREVDYVKALHALFDGYTPETALPHMQAHADAMVALAAKYPKDLEAQVFEALALVAAAPPDDTRLVHQHKAMAILGPLFKKYPNHPGIAHYITHACDNPQMAKDGLGAARRYASIAPASPHALHMPGHIFIRLGLWQDDIKTNLASKAAAEGSKVAAESRLHAMEFLEYAYLQAGQYDKAKAIVTEAGTIQASDVDPRFAGYAGFVKARFAMLLAVETQDWAMAAKLNNVGYATFGQALIALAHAICAGHTKDVARAMNARKLSTRSTPARRRTSSTWRRRRCATRSAPGRCSPAAISPAPSASCDPSPISRRSTARKRSSCPPARCSPRCTSSAASTRRPSPSSRPRCRATPTASTPSSAPARPPTPPARKRWRTSTTRPRRPTSRAPTRPASPASSAEAQGTALPSPSTTSSTLMSFSTGGAPTA